MGAGMGSGVGGEPLFYGDWCYIQSEESPYWWNQVTNETSWDTPREVELCMALEAMLKQTQCLFEEREEIFMYIMKILIDREKKKFNRKTKIRSERR